MQFNDNKKKSGCIALFYKDNYQRIKQLDSKLPGGTGLSHILP